ncbi:hypothetical protein RSAG8_06176, partial [Rhizoctonia solani AG-8 WAC10335]
MAHSFPILEAEVGASANVKAVYDRPEEIDPGRLNNISVPSTSAFGWGRHKCAGIQYAQSLLSISIASLLASLEFATAKDEGGNDIVSPAEDGPILA